jgi:cation:H+ antiporter
VEYLLLIVGLVGLILGGEFLVRGAVSLALKLHISPLVVGMTVVSFGTSAPELLVSLEGAFSGYPDVSVGAVIGSNISNVALVLGITVVIFPISVNRDSLRIDWPLMLIATALFYVFALNGILSFWEGFVFVSILASFTFWIIRRSRTEGKIVAAEQEVNEQMEEVPVIKNIAFCILGLVCLYFGAEWLIEGVVKIAKSFDISEKLISVSVVAFGTSLPELVTSAVAAFKKQTDISMGNLIGSNIFNLLAILGITSLAIPLEVSESVLNFDMYFLMAITLLLFPLMKFGNKIGFWKGIILILFYVAYIYFSFTHEFKGGV